MGEYGGARLLKGHHIRLLIIILLIITWNGLGLINYYHNSVDASPVPQRLLHLTQTSMSTARSSIVVTPVRLRNANHLLVSSRLVPIQRIFLLPAPPIIILQPPLIHTSLLVQLLQVLHFTLSSLQLMRSPAALRLLLVPRCLVDQPFPVLLLLRSSPPQLHLVTTSRLLHNRNLLLLPPSTS